MRIIAKEKQREEEGNWSQKVNQFGIAFKLFNLAISRQITIIRMDALKPKINVISNELLYIIIGVVQIQNCFSPIFWPTYSMMDKFEFVSVLASFELPWLIFRVILDL